MSVPGELRNCYGPNPVIDDNELQTLSSHLPENLLGLILKYFRSLYYSFHTSAFLLAPVDVFFMKCSHTVNVFRIVFEMLQEIREYIGSLYTLCENIAELDLVVSFAQTSKNFTFVRPTFSEDRMNIRSSVHPILNHVSRCRPVSNDIVRTGWHA